jgi:hypothetical protein
VPKFSPYGSVCCAKAWLAAHAEVITTELKWHNRVKT